MKFVLFLTDISLNIFCQDYVICLDNSLAILF